MIDIRELRKDPNAYAAKLARNGASDLVKELLNVDTAWRAATNAAESARAQKKPVGKPTPDQLQELQRGTEQRQETESELAKLDRRRKELLDRVPNPRPMTCRTVGRTISRCSARSARQGARGRSARQEGLLSCAHHAATS